MCRAVWLADLEGKWNKGTFFAFSEGLEGVRADNRRHCLLRSQCNACTPRQEEELDESKLAEAKPSLHTPCWQQTLYTLCTYAQGG